MSTKGAIFKAAAFAASQLDKATEQEFVEAQRGQLHHHDGTNISDTHLAAGYRQAKQARKDGHLVKFKVKR